MRCCDDIQVFICCRLSYLGGKEHAAEIEITSESASEIAGEYNAHGCWW